MPADRCGGFLAPVAMLALIHLSTASEPYPTQWRVRSSGLVRWDLAEFRLYSDAACRTEIPVLDNIASGRVHGDENPIARQHYFNDKVFDFDVMSYWAGVPDACGNTWVGGIIAGDEPVRCAMLHQSGWLNYATSVALEAWDTGFYANMILKREYGVDKEAVRQYFPLDHVVATTLDIYQELLGLSFTELPAGAFSRWHEDVRCFVVRDAAAAAEPASRIGHFYLDLHPREGKYGHAAIFHLLKRQGAQTPVDAMMCNLPAPSSDGTPARRLAMSNSPRSRPLHTPCCSLSRLTSGSPKRSASHEPCDASKWRSAASAVSSLGTKTTWMSFLCFW